MLRFNFSKLPVHVLYTLFKSFCMPLYGSALFDLDSRHMSRFYTAWRKAIRYIFHLPYRTHCKLLHLIVGDAQIEKQMLIRFVNFFINIYKSKNVLVETAVDIVLNGSGSAVSNSLSLAAEMLNVNRRDVFNVCNMKSLLSEQVDADLVCISKAITDCIDMRDDVDSFFNHNECTMMIEYLCTC
eukprot:GHVO01057094.1.p1 GENE.GHVO01057094.1~~GHVO01057094.1.p1  ORF type:complete len:184 (-),score=1.00 GHVO01057094.1:290-841(-)